MNSSNKLIIAMAAAAAAGAIIGVLLAPEKGSDLQKTISAKSRGWLTDLIALVTQAGGIADDSAATNNARPGTSV